MIPGSTAAQGDPGLVQVFAYGSNLCLQRIAARTHRSVTVSVAVLDGFKFGFRKRSRDGSAKADAVHTGVSDDRVWGVVYTIARSEKPILDRCEGLGKDYFEETVALHTVAGQELRASIYLGNPLYREPWLKPYSWYKDFVVTGARQHDLPRSYRRSIESVVAMDDPDADRAGRERAVLAQALAGGRLR